MDEQKNALVADDDEGPRDINRRYIEKLGYEIKTAEDGKQALDILNSSSDITLLVTDFEMPNMDGCELTKAIRKHSVYKELPVVMASGKAFEEKVQKSAKESGVTALICKPYNQEELKIVIETIEKGYLSAGEFMYFD